MVVYGQGRYDCPVHGPVDPLPRRREDLDAGVFEHLCPVGGEELAWRLVDESAPLRPRSLYAASKVAQEHYALAWSDAVEGSVDRAALPQCVWPRHASGHAVFGGGRDLPIRARKRRAAKVFEDGGQMRDFVHVDDVAAANVAAVGRIGSDRFLAANVCSGQPISIREVAQQLSRASGGPAPEVTGQYRSGDVRHIVADPARARDVLGFTATIGPEAGLRAFATAPLRN